MAFFHESARFALTVFTLVVITHVCMADLYNQDDQKSMWCVQGTRTNSYEQIDYVSCDKEYRRMYNLAEDRWIRHISHCLLFADKKKNTERDGYNWIVSGGCDFNRTCVNKHPSPRDKLFYDVQFNGSVGTLYCCNQTPFYCNDPRFTLTRNESSVLKSCFKGAINTTINKIQGMYEPCGVGAYCMVKTDRNGVDQYSCDNDNQCLEVTIQEHNKTCTKTKNRGACCCMDSYCNVPPDAWITRNFLIPQPPFTGNLVQIISFYLMIGLAAGLFVVIFCFYLCCCIRMKRSAIDQKYLLKYRNHHLRFEDSDVEAEEGAEAQDEAAAASQPGTSATSIQSRASTSAASTNEPLPTKSDW